ncbi:hypothetical protein [Sphingomonas sp.]|uniref:hypothetical protein n=1 Tax=Sphingomonas sp. TaxID=28214 RepID=UPI0035BBD055
MVNADKFEITPDPAASLLRITMRGHWDLATVTLYREALVRAVAAMRAAGCKPGTVCALVDARDGGAQSQEVVASFRDNLRGGDLAPRRLATLVSSALFRRQIERIAIPNQRLFTDEHDALAWLLSPEPAI